MKVKLHKIGTPSAKALIHVSSNFIRQLRRRLHNEDDLLILDGTVAVLSQGGGWYELAGDSDDGKDVVSSVNFLKWLHKELERQQNQELRDLMLRAGSLSQQQRQDLKVIRNVTKHNGERTAHVPVKTEHTKPVERAPVVEQQKSSAPIKTGAHDLKYGFNSLRQFSEAFNRKFHRGASAY